MQVRTSGRKTKYTSSWQAHVLLRKGIGEFSFSNGAYVGPRQKKDGHDGKRKGEETETESMGLDTRPMLQDNVHPQVPRTAITQAPCPHNRYPVSTTSTSRLPPTSHRDPQTFTMPTSYSSIRRSMAPRMVHGTRNIHTTRYRVFPTIHIFLIVPAQLLYYIIVQQ